MCHSVHQFSEYLISTQIGGYGKKKKFFFAQNSELMTGIRSISLLSLAIDCYPTHSQIGKPPWSTVPQRRKFKSRISRGKSITNHAPTCPRDRLYARNACKCKEPCPQWNISSALCLRPPLPSNFSENNSLPAFSPAL